MKTKYWIMLLLALALVCAGLSWWLFRPAEDAAQIQVLSQGQVLYTLDLNTDRQITVTTDTGSNTVSIRDGKVAVTAANCPDQHCVHRGWCDGGAQIVCLPNRLVIRFLGERPLDGVSG